MLTPNDIHVLSELLTATERLVEDEENEDAKGPGRIFEHILDNVDEIQAALIAAIDSTSTFGDE